VQRYLNEEIVSATKAVRNFSSLLKDVTKKGGKKRVIIVKNNRFDAVLLSIEEYEKLNRAYEILEQLYKDRVGS
jgi:prevent-host-death family protein